MHMKTALLIKEMTEEIQKNEANYSLILDEIATLTLHFFNTQKRLQELAINAEVLRTSIIAREKELEKLTDPI